MRRQDETPEREIVSAETADVMPEEVGTKGGQSDDWLEGLEESARKGHPTGTEMPGGEGGTGTPGGV